MIAVRAPEAAVVMTRRRPFEVLDAAAVTAAAGLAYLVAADGAPMGRLLRLAAVAAATYLFVRSSHDARLVRAVAALAAGIVATASGAAIAGPHLAKSGFSLLAAAGLVALAGGATLLIAGGAVLVAHLRGWRRAAAALVLTLFAGALLFSVAVAVAATNVPRTEVGSTDPSDLGIAFEDVELHTADGVTLSAWYVPSRNGAAVLLRHGAGSTRSAVLDHAVVLAVHGYGVLLADARGHGRSDGRAMDFGWYGDEDIAAGLDFLQQRSDVDPGRLAVLGLSMGGEEAIGATATDERIRSVVAEGATNRTAEDRTWLSGAYGFRGWVQERVDDVTYAVADLLTDADPPVPLRAAVALASQPVLLITAGDVPDELRGGRVDTFRRPCVRHRLERAGLRPHRGAAHRSRRLGGQGDDVPRGDDR